MDATQIILLVFIVLLIIIYPIMMFSRNKKENQRMQEQTNSLKRGDKVLTTSGIYGTIVDLQLDEDRKIVTIETGTDKKKGFVSIDAYAIYKVFTEEQNQENKDSTLKSDVSQPKDESNIQKKVIVDEEKLKSTTKTLESDSSNDKVEAEKEIKKNEDNR